MPPWPKGKSANPGGRPKQIISVVVLARSHTISAIEALVAALGDSKTRVAAAQVLLDRGWGRPAQTIHHTGSINGIDVSAVNTESLMQIVATGELPQELSAAAN